MEIKIPKLFNLDQDKSHLWFKVLQTKLLQINPIN
jgi:hypothetical protein